MRRIRRLFSNTFPLSPRLQNVPEQASPSGMFSYAHGFSIEEVFMAEHVTINEQAPTTTLTWLCSHTMQGVEHHSYARDPPPRCYEGTRTKFIAMVKDWLCSLSSTQRLLWVNGPAGVGKSAIAQTLAELEAANKGATLFFPRLPAVPISSRPRSGEAARIWTTICYRLATNHPSYLAYVQQEICRDPMLVEQNMAHQFRTLIAEPIGRRRLIKAASHFIPIFIDGLDQFYKPDVQEEVVRLIFNFIDAYPDAPVVWIITSRPERHLMQIFNAHQHHEEAFKMVSISVDSEDSRRDVQRFLRCRFNAIRRQYEVVEPSPWPIRNNFRRLLIATSGLFVLACAVTHFVGDREVANPVNQFDTILPIITSSPSSTLPPENIDPLHSVHNMYTHILQGISIMHYSVARRILGFCLLPSGFGHWAQDSTPFWTLCNILGIDENTAYACLSKLHSLLDVPNRPNATLSPLRFFHGSFGNYLTNREASEAFWIDTREVIADIWHCHFRVLQESYTADHPVPQLSNIQLAWPSNPEQNLEFRNDIWENARRVFFHRLLPRPSARWPYWIRDEYLFNVENPIALIPVLKEIHFHRLVDHYAFPDVPYRFLAFLDWVVQEGRSLLQERGLLQEFSFTNPRWSDSFNEQEPSFKIQVVRSDDGGRTMEFTTYADRRLINTEPIDPARLFSTGERPLPFSQLLHQLELSRRSLADAAAVVGKRQAGQCIILIDKSLQNRIVYYVLPCKLVN